MTFDPQSDRIRTANCWLADAYAHKAGLIQAVRGGDILMFSGWWAAPENAVVKSIYEAAGTAPATGQGK